VGGQVRYFLIFSFFFIKKKDKNTNLPNCSKAQNVADYGQKKVQCTT
jgi:hypothetical protein